MEVSFCDIVEIEILTQEMKNTVANLLNSSFENRFFLFNCDVASNNTLLAKI